MIPRRASPRSGVASATLRAPAAVWAETVHLEGEFSGCPRPSSHLMPPKDTRSISLELATGKAEQYRYL